MKRNLILAMFLLAGCTKPVVEGKDHSLPPLSRNYSSSVTETWEAAKKGLTLLGYEIRKESQDEGLLLTQWTPARATSHYTDVFGEKDYGTVGTYYHLRLKVREREGKTEVQISAPVRSLAQNQRSSYREEKKVLNKIGDLLRSDSFKITNLGAE